MSNRFNKIRNMWSLSTMFASSSRLIGGNALRSYAASVMNKSVYAPSSLGMDNFIQTKTLVENQFRNNMERYRDKMNKFIREDPNAMIFTDDLKNMAYLCEKEDVELVRLMIERFNAQDREIRFGNFIFGPVLMRMYFFLDLPDEALKVFESNKNNNFFDQITTYLILMNLLYKHEKYDEIYRVFHHVKEKQNHMIKFPRSCVNIMMATCYRQNTKESFEYAINLWSELSKMGHASTRKTIYYFTGLALKQSAPHIALEALSRIGSHRHMITMNLKIVAYVDLNRLDDTIPILRSVIDIDSPMLVQNRFIKEVLDKLMEKVNQQPGNKVLEREFNQIHDALKKRNLISNDSLEFLITQEIKLRDKNDKDLIHTSFRANTPHISSIPRKSLYSMY